MSNPAPGSRRVTEPPVSSVRHRRVARRALIGIAAALLSMATAVGLASPAQAWTDSADVDLFGLASCKTVPYAMDIPPSRVRVHVNSTGETAEPSVNQYTWYWMANLRTIPPQGSLVDLSIHCEVPGIGPEWRLVRSTFVRRPWFGQLVQTDWATA